MNEECINISKCICQWRLMQVLFFSFCNIKIVALINSLLKPPSAALSAHTEERGEERGAIYSLLSLSLGKESERQIDKKKMHSFPPFLCLSFFLFFFLFCSTGNDYVLGFMEMLGSHRATMLLNLALFLLSGVLPSAYRHMRRHIAPHCAQQGDKFLCVCQFKQA